MIGAVLPWKPRISRLQVQLFSRCCLLSCDPVLTGSLFLKEVAIVSPMVSSDHSTADWILEEIFHCFVASSFMDYMQLDSWLRSYWGRSNTKKDNDKSPATCCGLLASVHVLKPQSPLETYCERPKKGTPISAKIIQKSLPLSLNWECF